MDLQLSPIFPPLLILGCVLAVLALLILRRPPILESALWAGFLLLLLTVGFRPELTTNSSRPPDQPVEIVHEYSLRAGSLGIPQRARDLHRELEARIGPSFLERSRLDSRWDTPPAFRDYGQLRRGNSAGRSLQVIVGSGRHTAPTALPARRGAPPDDRALWVPPGAGADTTPSLLLPDPVQHPDPSERVRWEVRVTRPLDTEQVRLRLRKGKRVLDRHALPPGKGDTVVRVQSPPLGEGLHYLIVELLTGEEQGLPAGHPRRSGAGALVAADHRDVLISDRTPGWRSGWWGRKVGDRNRGELRYHYRHLTPPASADTPPRNPDLVIYFGVPESERELERFRSYRRSESGLLLIATPTSSPYLAETLQALGLGVERPRWSTRDTPAPTLTDTTSAEFPSLIGFAPVLSQLPPLGGLLGGVTSGELTPLVQAGSELVFALHPSQPRGFLSTDQLHRSFMRYASYEGRTPGRALIGEITGKLLRLREVKHRGLFARSWVRAGESVEMTRQQGEIRRLVVRGPWDRRWEKEIPRTLRFPRAGVYRVRAGSDRNQRHRDRILVLEPDAERLNRGRTIRGEMVRKDRVFRDRDALIGWIERTWKRRHTRRRTVWLSWDHPLVLFLLAGSLMGAWYLRDLRRGARE